VGPGKKGIAPLASDSGASKEVRNFSYRCQDSALIQRGASRKFCAAYHPHKTATHGIRGLPKQGDVYGEA